MREFEFTQLGGIDYISKLSTGKDWNRSKSHTLALLPSVKRKVFCVRDGLKMVKHKAWATTIVAPKSVGSMTTKDRNQNPVEKPQDQP